MSESVVCKCSRIAQSPLIAWSVRAPPNWERVLARAPPNWEPVAGARSVCAKKLVCQRCLVLVRAPPNWKPQTGAKQAVCQETRLSAAPIVRCGRRAPDIAAPERNTRGCAESCQRGIRLTPSTRTTVIRFLHGVVSQLFCADGRKCGT